MSDNKGVKKAMVERYGSECMATGQKSKKVSYHHRYKKEWGGQATIENGALLLDAAQSLIHNSIEKEDIELYYLANECFELYKQCMDLGLEELVSDYREEVMPEYRKLIYGQSKGKRG